MLRFRVEGVAVNAVGDEGPAVGYVDAPDADAARAEAGRWSTWRRVDRMTRVPWDEGVDWFDRAGRAWRRLWRRGSVRRS